MLRVILVAELTINLIVMNQLKSQFEFVEYLAERFTVIFLSAREIRHFTSMLDDYEKPEFYEEDFQISKNYVSPG